MSGNTISSERMEEALLAVIFLDCWMESQFCGRTIDHIQAIKELESKGFNDVLVKQDQAEWTLAHEALAQHLDARRLKSIDYQNALWTYRATSLMANWVRQQMAGN